MWYILSTQRLIQTPPLFLLITILYGSLRAFRTSVDQTELFWAYIKALNSRFKRPRFRFVYNHKSI